MESNYQRERMRLLKEKRELIKLKNELSELKREKLQLLKLRKEVRELKTSPEVLRLKKLGKKALISTGKGVGRFLTKAYQYGELATRPQPTKLSKRRKSR